MATKALPSQEVLRQLLRYDPETGKLFWRPRGREWFASNRQFKTWNSRYANSLALNSVDPTGYLLGAVLGDNYRSHRVIWKMMTGDDPILVDHVNGVRTDNRWSNLRSVDDVENGKNQGRRIDSTSGVTGVCWGAHVGKWMAYIGSGGRAARKRTHIGVFDSFEDAVAARKKAERAMGFHKNHGRAAS